MLTALRVEDIITYSQIVVGYVSTPTAAAPRCGPVTTTGFSFRLGMAWATGNAVSASFGVALPNGLFAGSPEDALECACGLCVNNPTAWLPDRH